MRGQVSRTLYAVDASNTKFAVVSTLLPERIADEIYRIIPQKGSWSRMLRSADTWLYEHELLPPEATVPGEALKAHPCIAAVASSSQFVVESVHRYPRCAHITIGEVRASLLAERAHAHADPLARVMSYGESQVGTCALLKGRSSSPSLNIELVSSLPHLVSGQIYTYQCWGPSATNPAGDPTRDRVCQLHASQRGTAKLSEA
jgi:hypothetical protein